METILSTALHGAVYGDNFGDVLIHGLLASELSQRGLVTSLPMSVKKFRTALHEQFGEYGSFPSPKSSFRGIVFGPGGYLSAPPGHLSAWRRRFYPYHLPVILASKFARKTAFFGLEVGPIEDSFAVQVLRPALERSDVLAVRTVESAEWVGKILPRRQVEIIPDVALALSPEWVLNRDNSSQSKVKDAQILFHVGMANLWRENAAVRATPAILRRHGSVTVISDTSRLSRATNQILPTVNIDSGIHQDYRGVSDLLRKIASASLVVTTKLHVGICAYAFGIPVVQLAQHPKTGDFNRSTTSQGQAHVPLEHYHADELDNLIQDAVKTAQSDCWRRDRLHQKHRIFESVDDLALSLKN